MTQASNLRKLTCCIFAGGRATRLYPHSVSPQNQKSLLVMGDPAQKLADYALRAGACCDHTLIFTSSDHERSMVVEDYVLQWPNIIVLRDKREVAAGSILDYYARLSEEDAGGDIAVLAPDHVHEGLELRDLYQHHLEAGRPVTILTSPAKNYGGYTMNRDGLAEGVLSGYIHGAVSTCGTYIVKTSFLMGWARRCLAEGWNGQTLGLYQDLVCPAIERGEVSVFPLPIGAYWDDAGTLLRYYHNNMRISGGKSVVAVGVVVADGASLSESVVIAGAVIESPLAIRRAIVSGSSGSFRVTQVGAQHLLTAPEFS